MSADLLKICDPIAYYNQFILESVYPDGRPINSFRPIILQMTTNRLDTGLSTARLGEATVTCKIEPSISAISDSPVIVPHVEGNSIIPQDVIEDAEELIDQLVKQDAFFTRDSLKAANGRLTWVLHLYISILSVDGSVLDVLTTCVLSALMDLRLPNIICDFEEDIPIEIKNVKVADETTETPLSDTPVSCTFIIYKAPDKEEKILCDPVMELYSLMPYVVTVVVGNNFRIHRIIQHCLIENSKTLKQMIGLAFSRQKVVSESLKKAKSSMINDRNYSTSVH